MLNKVILVGNLGKDPDIRTLDSGVTRATFSIATNENYKDKSGQWQQVTEWHDIVIWRALAERAKFLKKGMLVYIEGRLTHRKFTDKDGRDVSRTDVSADMLKILEKKEPNSSNSHNDKHEESFTPDVTGEEMPF